MGWTGDWLVDLPLMVCVIYTLTHSGANLYRRFFKEE